MQKNKVDVVLQNEFCLTLANRLYDDIFNSLLKVDDMFYSVEKSTVYKQDIIRLRRELLKLSKMIT